MDYCKKYKIIYLMSLKYLFSSFMLASRLVEGCVELKTLIF